MYMAQSVVTALTQSECEDSCLYEGVFVRKSIRSLRRRLNAFLTCTLENFLKVGVYFKPYCCLNHFLTFSHLLCRITFLFAGLKPVDAGRTRMELIVTLAAFP